MTDNTGTQVEALTYYPFGQTRTNVPGTPVNVAHKYTGKELDNATGLYFYEARYYDAILCRFISADTLVGNPKDPQDLNRYGYARNNPLKYTDPTGHFVEWVIAVAIVAGAVTAGIQSDWNPKAVVLGAVIAGASAAAGSAAGIYVSSSLGAGALAGGVIGGIAGGLTYATLNQLAGNKANWGPSIAYGGVAGGVAAGVGGAVSTFTDSQAVQAIVGAVAAGATRAGLGGGNIVKGALMSAAVAAVTTYLVVEYGTSPAEAQVKAQEDNASRALQTQQSDLGQRAGMFGAGPLIEYLGGYVLSSRIGLTLTEMLMADAGYLGYNRSTGLMQFEKAGGFGEANRLFDSFLAEGGTLLRSQESGLRVLQYGRDTFITVRPYSSGGFPTLDVHTPELIFKFRF
ncbi:MAG: RHS repeat-associated core domain-containing protein [Nitrospirae bacterium]|nr:RHS repeat-associated core domain-containing protein [Nitrospirota bacterium]